MKKCFYFPTWEGQKDVMISLDEKIIDIPFAKDGFNITKNQEFYNYIEVELSHSLEYNRVYRGNLQLIKGSSTNSKSEQEFVEHQNKYQKFQGDFDKLYNDYKIEFREEYRTNWIRFIRSIPPDPIFQKYPLLLELQKKLGFDVYGDYVVLDEITGYKCGGNLGEYEDYLFGNVYDIKFEQDKSDDDKYHRDRIFRLVLKMSNYSFDLFNKNLGIGFYKDIRYGDIEIVSRIGNCIEELSKYYRGEENKFEEIRKVLGV